MSDAAGFAMASGRQYEQMRREVAEAAAAEDRALRRDAAVERLDGVDTVFHADERWRLLEIQPDGRVVLEQWDDMKTVEPTKVEPVYHD